MTFTMAVCAFAVPILPGKTEALRQFAQEVFGSRRSDFKVTAQMLGVRKESWHFQNTPQGDVCIVYFEADDPWQVLREFAAAQRPFDVWFKEQAKQISGIDFGQPLPGPLSECMGEL